MKKKVHKMRKVMICILALVFVIFAFPLAACDSSDKGGEQPKPTPKPEGPVPEGALRVTFNYYRPDEAYDDWDLWVWADGKDGAGYAFTTTKIEGKTFATSTVTLEGINMSSEEPVSFIVRKGGDAWSGKDPDMDRAIPMTRFTDRKATIYLASGREELFENAAEAINPPHRMTSAYFFDFETVRIKTDSEITASSCFKIYAGDDLVKTYDMAQNESSVGKKDIKIKLDGEADLSKPYVVKDEPASGFDAAVNFNPKSVNKSDLFGQTDFNKRYSYDGELGAIYSAASTTFKVWSPLASVMKVNVYNAGDGTETPTTTAMTLGEKGVWSATVNGDLSGRYYTYTVTAEGKTKEVVDPYARSAGKNGVRGMILNLDSTDPTGWADQQNPALASYSDAVIYEAQLRDLTIHESSKVSADNRGKYLGMTEKGKNSDVTPLQYLKDLGITAVHFQPLFDFASVDESFTQATYNKGGQYNWGYDPLNYNVPEGSYSSDPSDGAKRVKEMKQMIMALHNEGIQVVMDVVYNHVSSAPGSNFEALVPGYYFRTKDDGSLYNGSGCGNETASERAMFRKFMVDSVKYWTEEYNIDGFRFDLMGLHDITTMNEIYDTVAEINPDVMIYGEGWTGGTSGLSDRLAALQKNASQIPNIAVFNDIVRDGLKGSVFDVGDTGFVSGKGEGTDAAIYVGAAGATDVLSSDVYGELDKSFFAADPTQSINYVSAHDNSTLWDKLNASVDAKDDVLKAMNRLAAAAVITSRGPSFFLAGEELLRSKPTEAENDYDNRPNAYLTDEEYYFSDNSYKSPDSVNAIDWTKATKNADMVSYYKGLIAVKKALPQLRISDHDVLEECFVMIDDDFDDGIAVYAIKDPESNNYAVLVFNATDEAMTVDIPTAAYQIYVEGAKASATALGQSAGGAYRIEAYSATVMVGEIADISGWEYSVNSVAAA